MYIQYSTFPADLKTLVFNSVYYNIIQSISCHITLTVDLHWRRDTEATAACKALYGVHSLQNAVPHFVWP